jgi:hypothetical protein
MKEVIAVLIIIWLALYFLSGCASTSPRLDPNYMAYLEAMRNQPKILEIEAQEGQTIEFKGVKKFTVYGGQNSSIAEYKPSPTTQEVIAKEMIGAAKILLPIWFISQSIEHIFDEVVHYK